MIIVHLSGGLGNQMFQYAFGRANTKCLGALLALELSDKTLQIHNGFELGRIFNIHAKMATQADLQAVLGVQRYSIIRNSIKGLGLRNILLSRYVEEPHFHFAPQMLDIADNRYVYGYWQSEKYFREIVTTIRSDFSFKQPLANQNTEIAEKISHINSVSLHVRRNDYAKNPKINATHGLCSLEYYRESIRYVVERVKQPQFFVFSDDIAWVKNNLKIDFPCQFVDHNQGTESYNDMRLMSMCKHHIIANSSFSWWGAWLNPNMQKIVVAPKKWFAHEADTRDLIPEKWVLL